jgi:hypothetical protein
MATGAWAALRRFASKRDYNCALRTAVNPFLDAAGKTFCAFASCIARKPGICRRGKPRSAYTPRPCFARSETHSGNPAYKPGNYVSVVLRVCYFAYGFLCLPTLAASPSQTGLLVRQHRAAPRRPSYTLFFALLHIQRLANTIAIIGRDRPLLRTPACPFGCHRLLGTTSSGVGTNSSISSLRIRPGP